MIPVGKILAALEKSGKAANTLVVFSSHNGGIPTAQNNDPQYPAEDYDPGPAGGSNVPLREQKSEVYEGGIRTPAIVRWPGKLKPGVFTAFAQGGEAAQALDLRRLPQLARFQRVGAGFFKLPHDGADHSRARLRQAHDPLGRARGAELLRALAARARGDAVGEGGEDIEEIEVRGGLGVDLRGFAEFFRQQALPREFIEKRAPLRGVEPFFPEPGERWHEGEEFVDRAAADIPAE